MTLRRRSDQGGYNPWAELSDRVDNRLDRIETRLSRIEGGLILGGVIVGIITPIIAVFIGKVV